MVWEFFQFIIHHSSFIIHHSSFIIHHSSFIIHHSSFIIHHSSFIIHHSSFIIHHFLLMSIIQKCVVWALLFVAGSVAAQKNQKPAELRIVLPNVQFAKEKSVVKGAAADELNEVAALMKKSPAVTLEIGAHTDAGGNAAYNLRLSQQRAAAVSAYLVKKESLPNGSKPKVSGKPSCSTGAGAACHVRKRKNAKTAGLNCLYEACLPMWRSKING
jgi:hypothetical protein